MRPLLAVVVALVVATPALAGPGKVAVGLERGASAARVAAAAEARTGGTASTDLAPLAAITVRVDDVDSALPQLRRLRGVSYVERLDQPRHVAFTPNDALFTEQWYLPLVRAFDAWPEVPALNPVLVAVVDSGIDADHPDFAGRIEDARSFVSSPATTDSIGHGTMVAGEIAAATNDGVGIASGGFSARLLIAKVVSPNGSIPLEAEAKAIRWAVDRGARVINLSLGGHRDPDNPSRDTFSELEAAAVRYAVKHNVLLVAATGNCAAVCPYRYASYPAALPHVLGVSAIREDSTVPGFSNRDRRYNDLAAPGVGIVSTFPFALSVAGCAPAGYTLCAPDTYVRGEGTSFAAPIVSAAAAVLFASRPELRASQAAAILKRTATDISAAGRDGRTGNGRLDVAAAVAALAEPFPVRDRFESNDDAGREAFFAYFPRKASTRVLAATLDYYEDARDVYAVRIKRGQRLTITYRGTSALKSELAIYSPGTKDVETAGALRALTGFRSRARVRYRATKGGWHFIELRAAAGTSGDYRISVRRD